MSGKEADVYVVVSQGQMRCAKVYKDSNTRSFRQRADYQEGRGEKSSRRARAMEKGSKFGRKEMEEAWQSAEVDALYKLAAVGVRVPTPHVFDHGVLLMDLVTDADGEVAPRLIDVAMTPDEARQVHKLLIGEVVKMLCAGLIHGDLSEYNVLLGADGPVIIDLPQVVHAAGNNNAARLLERDLDALSLCLGRFAPELRKTDYGKEIWELYQKGHLHPEVKLTGKFQRPTKAVDLQGVLRDIEDARVEAMRRLGT
jgi:RIO kinase 1